MFFQVFVLTVLAVSDSLAARRYYITSKSACIDCGYNGQSYQWCYTGSGGRDWDYCSRVPGTSTRNKKCRWNHQCDYHGQKYLWCYLEGGSWDYCGKVEDSSTTYYTTRGQLCYNFCDTDGGDYKCRKQDRNTDHCSPVPNIAAHGPGCKAQSGSSRDACGNHGYSYRWCYTNGGSWGYCSLVQSDHQSRARPSNDICFNAGGTNMRMMHASSQNLANGIRRVTAVVVAEPTPNRIRMATGNYRNDAQRCLFNWHQRQETNGNTNAGTQQRHGTIRLDIQGSFNSENMGRFVNWQLQINGQTQSPSTVAHVNIQLDLRGFDDAGWRRFLVQGLHVSLNRAATVWVFQQQIDQNGYLQCPRSLLGPVSQQLDLGMNETQLVMTSVLNDTQEETNLSRNDTQNELIHGLNESPEELQLPNAAQHGENQEGDNHTLYESEYNISVETSVEIKEILELGVSTVQPNETVLMKNETEDAHDSLS